MVMGWLREPIKNAPLPRKSEAGRLVLDYCVRGCVNNGWIIQRWSQVEFRWWVVRLMIDDPMVWVPECPYVVEVLCLHIIGSVRCYEGSLRFWDSLCRLLEVKNTCTFGEWPCLYGFVGDSYGVIVDKNKRHQGQHFCNYAVEDDCLGGVAGIRDMVVLS